MVVVEAVFTLGEIEELVEFFTEINIAPDAGFPNDIALAQGRVGDGLTGGAHGAGVEVAQIIFIIGSEDVLRIDRHACDGEEH